LSENLDLDVQERIDFVWSVIEHTSAWIQSADNKAAASIAVNILIAGFLLTNASGLAINPSYTSLTAAMPIAAVPFLLIMLIAHLLSILFAFFCLTSRTGLGAIGKRLLEPNIERPGESLVFFNSIAKLGRQGYLARLNQMDRRWLLNDLAGQAYVLSALASQKHKWNNRSFTCLGLTLFLLICFGYAVMM